MLVSIQLNSNRPENIREFVNNIDETATNPKDIEVIFHIDNGDIECQTALEDLQKTTKTKLRYIQTDIIKCYQDLWRPLNEILKVTDPSAYFVTNFNDELRFKTKGWDDEMRKYISYYDDDIFRVRLSRYRFYNYKDYWETIFAPDGLAFYTKRWMDIVGMWCPCMGPDSWQQSVAYYLLSARKFDHLQYNRDITDPFLKFSGEGVHFGLSDQKLRERIRDNVGLWFETVSCEMQEKAKYAAAKLQANIIINKKILSSQRVSCNFITTRKPPMFQTVDLNKVYFKNNENKKTIELVYRNRVVYSIDYKLNKIKLFILNNFRKIHYCYYAGGGQESYRKDLISQINSYVRMRKYGILCHNGSSMFNLRKPTFFKKHRALSMLWPIIKILLILIKILESLLKKIAKFTKMNKLVTKWRKYFIKKYHARFGIKGLHKPKTFEGKKIRVIWPIIKIGTFIGFIGKIWHN